MLTNNIMSHISNAESQTLNLERIILQGMVVRCREPETIVAGWHKDMLDVWVIASEVYLLRANLCEE